MFLYPSRKTPYLLYLYNLFIRDSVLSHAIVISNLSLLATSTLATLVGHYYYSLKKWKYIATLARL